MEINDGSGCKKGWKEKYLFSIDDFRTRGATSWNQKTTTKDFVGEKKKYPANLIGEEWLKH